MVNYFTITQTIPATNITLNNPTINGYISYNGATYTKTSDADAISMGYKAGSTTTDRGFIEWDINDIPSTASITTIKFLYHGYLIHGIDCQIHGFFTYRPNTSDADDIYTEAYAGNLYADIAGFPVIGSNQVIVLGSTWSDQACIDMKTNQLSKGWFAIGLISDNETTPALSYIASSLAGFCNPPPSLYIEYNYTSTVTLGICNVASKTYNRNLEKHLFRDGTYAAHDAGKQSLNLILSGTESSTPTTKFASIYSIMDMGEPITISGFTTDTSLNTTWLIDDFVYDAIIGIPSAFNWKMTLTSPT